jgi:hypothetical protein
MAESVITVESQRFRLDPGQSYVSKEVRDTDPAFWLPKKVVVKTVAPKPAPAPAKPPTLER